MMMEPALQNVLQDIYQMLTGDVLNVKELVRSGVTLVMWTGQLHLFVNRKLGVLMSRVM